MRRSDRLTALVQDLPSTGSIILVRNEADGALINTIIDNTRPEIAGNAIPYAIVSPEAANAVLATAKGKSVYIDNAFLERGNRAAVRRVKEALKLSAKAS